MLAQPILRERWQEKHFTHEQKFLLLGLIRQATEGVALSELVEGLIPLQETQNTTSTDSEGFTAWLHEEYLPKLDQCSIIKYDSTTQTAYPVSSPPII